MSDILTMPDVVYSYGYNIGYGIGFGGPFLLPTYLADTNFGNRTYSSYQSTFFVYISFIYIFVDVINATNIYFIL